jgi:uncharacterized BrkB/YihY/UPF0761 family membrane protein
VCWRRRTSPSLLFSSIFISLLPRRKKKKKDAKMAMLLAGICMYVKET